MRILLATDGSEQSAVAVDAIFSRNFSADSEVRVISVVEPPFLPEAFSGGGGNPNLNANLYLELENSVRERAQAAVDKAAAKLRANEKTRQLKITTDVLSGLPKNVILEEADTFGADLIVVGSHGHGMLERFLLGSVSQAVAVHARCSVEIVRNPKTKTAV